MAERNDTIPKTAICVISQKKRERDRTNLQMCMNKAKYSFEYSVANKDCETNADDYDLQLSRVCPLTHPQQNPYPPLFGGIPLADVNFWVRTFFRGVKGAGRPEVNEKHKETVEIHISSATKRARTTHEHINTELMDPVTDTQAADPPLRFTRRTRTRTTNDSMEDATPAVPPPEVIPERNTRSDHKKRTHTTFNTRALICTLNLLLFLACAVCHFGRPCSPQYDGQPRKGNWPTLANEQQKATYQKTEMNVKRYKRKNAKKTQTDKDEKRTNTTHERRIRIEQTARDPLQGILWDTPRWDRYQEAHHFNDKVESSRYYTANKINTDTPMPARKTDGCLTICECVGSAPQGLTTEITEAGQEEPMLDDTISLSGPAGSAGSKRERSRMEEGDTDGTAESGLQGHTHLTSKLQHLSTGASPPQARGKVTDGQLKDPSTLMKFLEDISMEEEPAQGLTYGDILEEAGKRSTFGILGQNKVAWHASITRGSPTAERTSGRLTGCTGVGRSPWCAPFPRARGCAK